MTAPHALQPAFPGFCPVPEAVEMLATEGGIEERGAIYTKREVVDFILDLTGYTADASLTYYRLLEPSFGDGDFLLPAIDRLLESDASRDVLSYSTLAQRYDLLCKRLVQEWLYSSATFLASPRDAACDGRYRHLSDLTSLKTFVIEFAGHISAVAESKRFVS
ncbi:PaeR7I family type II restriction endonuclease [Rhodovulum sulfidophilum]|uniref:PaeR7I family type II restriction endonuclease n=1 Tax=Rhodovulum sulfidophilum TaxID=35806 RepID=UPI001922F217|nr:PaeR7I family type II restriction endonuclease [Rhodovulum sulfidophilum]MBL3575666.1 hypothetical protein [Rhodovulum sulfidophilum]MCE8432043.1 PaeR7I family type II restriction endonuclease [Rhodovulum sulfidophilum]MCF4118583.1 PaeR7I family type II restriction endonuclease [Rhodovulum sulfidophilum]